jgi:anaerobic selenocysteine-containing dehydrogenase
LNGTKLIVADPRRIELAEKADIFPAAAARHRHPASERPDAYHHQGKPAGPEVHRRANGRALRTLKAAVEKYTPARVSEMTGVPENLLYDAAACMQPP